MKRYYYYIRDELETVEEIQPADVSISITRTQRRPVITVCLLESEGRVSRGVSVCSTERSSTKKGRRDNIEKSKGRKEACFRAVNALIKRGCSEPFNIGNKRLAVFPKKQRDMIKEITGHLSKYAPKLTALEDKLVYGGPAHNPETILKQTRKNKIVDSILQAAINQATPWSKSQLNV